MTHPLRPILLQDMLRQVDETIARVAASQLPPLEEFVLGKDWCWTIPGADPTNTQRAIVMAAAGREITPETTGLTLEQMRFHFGTDRIAPSKPPKTVGLNAGVRGGKSVIAGCAGLIYGALTADMSNVRPGERVRSLISAPRLEQSLATYAHIAGTMMAQPNLRRFVDGEPKAESLWIKRLDGYRVLVQVVAASYGGINLRSTWVAGCVFDEADFHDGEEAKVNLEENRAAVLSRLLPGAQEWVVSSPYIDSGQFYEFIKRYFGRPNDGAITIHSDSRSMNPTLDPLAEAQMRARDAERAAREYDAIPMSSSSEDFFPLSAIEAVMGEIEPPREGVTHWGGVDLGYRKNSSALALARSETVGGVCKAVVSYVEELRPERGKQLKPSEVALKFAIACHAHNCNSMKGDLHDVPSTHENLAKIADATQNGTQDGVPHGIRIAVSYEEWTSTQAEKADVFVRFRQLMFENRMKLPNDSVLKRQLQETKMKRLPGGKVDVQLPKSGWTHGDKLIATVLAVTRVPLHEVNTDDVGIYFDEGSRYDDMAF